MSAPLVYCAPHGLDACYRCCVDYRPLNHLRASSFRGPLCRTREDAVQLLTGIGQPYEIITNKRGHAVFKNAPATVRDMLEWRMASATTVPFLTFVDGATPPLMYADAWKRALVLAAALQNKFGIGRGDAVGLLLPNSTEYVLAMLAIIICGGLAVLFNSHWPREMVQWAAKDSECKILFRQDQEGGGQVVVGNDGVGFADLMRDWQGKSPKFPTLSSEDNVLLLYTSGSTGNPKGVAHTSLNILSAIFAWEVGGAVDLAFAEIAPPYVPQHKVLCAVPLFHAIGSHVVLLGSIRMLRHLVLMNKWNAPRAVDIISQHGITMFSAPPTMTGDLVRAASQHSDPLALRSLLTIGGGGSGRAPKQVQQIAALNQGTVAPSIGWGMTETCASGCGFSGPNYVSKPLSSGLPSLLMELRIVGEESGKVETAPGVRGELQARGAAVIQKNWRRPDADKTTFTSDGGWLSTGDIAFIDADGFVYIVDRKKDLVIRGGENISCGLVEAAILEQPHCIEACVFSVPDDRMVEEVGAVVVVDKGGSTDASLLRAGLSTRLARFEIPRYISFLHEPLPRLGSGKVDKLAVRQRALKEFLSKSKL